MTETIQRPRTFQQFINGQWVDSAAGETPRVDAGQQPQTFALGNDAASREVFVRVVRSVSVESDEVIHREHERHDSLARESIPVGGHDKWKRVHKVRSNLHQDASLADGLPHAPQISVLKVPEPSVDDLQVIRGSGVSEVPLVHQGDGQAAQSSVPCAPDPVDPPAQDQDVVFVICQTGKVSLHGCN